LLSLHDFDLRRRANMRFQPTASLACARFAAAEARAVMPPVV